MERAENSDLDTSLAPVNMEIFFENKNLEEKFRSNTQICVFNSVRRYYRALRAQGFPTIQHIFLDDKS
jgi:hypothetical protein